MSEKKFDDWNWVIIFNEESFWSILRNEHVVVIQLITELDELFRGVDGALKSSVEKLIPRRNLPPLKTTESVGYDFVRLYE